MNKVTNEYLDTDEKNMVDILKKYLQYWPYFLIGIIICLCSVYLYIRYKAESRYAIQSTIFIRETAAGKGVNDIDAFNNLGLIKTSHSIEDEIGILKSSGMMEKVISKLSLNVAYYIQGKIKDVEIYGNDVPVEILIDETSEDLVYELPININIINANTYELKTIYEEQTLQSTHAFGDLVSKPFGTLTVKKNDSTTYEKSEKLLYFVIKNKDRLVPDYLKNLNIIPANKGGNLLNIDFLSTSKEKGEDIVAGLIETYVVETIKYENELAENTIQMIDDRLTKLSGEIESVESNVENFKSKNVITDVASNANSYIGQANDYKNRISEYQSQINVLGYVEESFNSGGEDVTISSSVTMGDAILGNMLANYNETLMEKKRLAQSTPSSNPIIVNLDTTLNSLRSSILQNVRSTKNGLVIAQRNLQSNASRYDAQIAKVPSMERKLLDISRQQSTKEGLFLYLLQKREEEVLSMAAPVSSTRIVSLPKASLFPVSPNKTFLYLGGLLLGVFFPFSIIFIKNTLNTRVQSIEDTSKMTIPLLGKISKNKEKNIAHFDDSRESVTAELFHLLRFNLDYLKKTKDNQILLITSSIKGEGKTFIASNLGVSLATAGEKVVIISFDLRQPTLMGNFKMTENPGVTDFIIKKGMDVNEILQKHPSIDNLTLIGSGPIVQQVNTMMLSNQIGLLINELKQKFDRIILDTAPIGIISDAFALNPFVDSTIFVVRRGVTKKKHLDYIETIHKNEKLKNCMILFNDDKEVVDTYGYSKA